MSVSIVQPRASERLACAIWSALALSALLAGCRPDSEAAAPQVRPVRTVTVEKHEAGSPVTLTGRIEAKDEVALGVMNYVLGGGSASRLYSRVREEGGLAYAVYSYANPARYGASFIVSAQTRTAEVPKVIEIMREELARMTREPVTERELKLAKDYLIGSFPLRLDTTSKVADFIVAVEEQGLGLDYADRYKERVAKVTAADVQRVAAKYFAPDTFNRVVVGAPKP